MVVLETNLLEENVKRTHVVISVEFINEGHEETDYHQESQKQTKREGERAERRVKGVNRREEAVGGAHQGC